MNRLLALALTALFTLAATAVAHAAVWYVANNGVDSLLCGSREAPCRSISAAIARAAESGDRIVVGPGRYGDVNGDGTFDDPGDEAAELQDGPGCGCLVHVNKILTIESEDGAGATVLDAGGRPISVVRISIHDVVFGRRDRGFTLVGGRTGVHIAAVATRPRNVRGVRVESNRSAGHAADGFRGELVFQPVTMVGNVAAANGRHGFVLSEAHQATELAGNTATDNAGAGFSIVAFRAASPPERELAITENFAGGNGQDGFALDLEAASDITMNVASHNGGTGFAVTGGGSARALHNAAIANEGFGFSFLEGGGLDLRRNAVHGNRLGGILTQRLGIIGEIARNNIFGNGAAANCGLVNASGDELVAGGNFWGTADGPGPDPADAVCDVAPATTIVAPAATGPFSLPIRIGR